MINQGALDYVNSAAVPPPVVSYNETAQASFLSMNLHLPVHNQDLVPDAAANVPKPAAAAISFGTDEAVVAVGAVNDAVAEVQTAAAPAPIAVAEAPAAAAAAVPAAVDAAAPAAVDAEAPAAVDVEAPAAGVEFAVQ